MNASKFRELTRTKNPTHKIINKSTGIHHVSAEGKENAEAVAKEMSEYHGREFFVKKIQHIGEL